MDRFCWTKKSQLVLWELTEKELRDVVPPRGPAILIKYACDSLNKFPWKSQSEFWTIRSYKSSKKEHQKKPQHTRSKIIFIWYWSWPQQDKRYQRTRISSYERKCIKCSIKHWGQKNNELKTEHLTWMPHPFDQLHSSHCYTEHVLSHLTQDQAILQTQKQTQERTLRWNLGMKASNLYQIVGVHAPMALPILGSRTNPMGK